MTATKKVANLLGLQEDDYLKKNTSYKDLKEELVGVPLQGKVVENWDFKKIEKYEPKMFQIILAKKPKLYVSVVSLLLLLAVIFFQARRNLEDLNYIEQNSLMQKEFPKEVAQKSPDTLNIAASKLEQSQKIAVDGSLVDSSTCPVTKNNIPRYLSVSASQFGNQVYVVAKNHSIIICFEDVQGKKESKQLAPNMGYNFNGKAPFKLVSSALDQVDVFYQGYKVKADLSQQALILEEKLILD